VISGLSGKLWILVLSRGMSGLGGALDEPSGTAMILRAFPYSQRPIFLGISGNSKKEYSCKITIESMQESQLL